MAFDLHMPVPSAKQKQFLTAREFNIAFGGARGGGKSMAVRMKAGYLALRYPGIRCCIVRKTYPELLQNHIEPMLRMYPRQVARYNKADKLLTFINGSKILFKYCSNLADTETFQGVEVDNFFLDEATQHDEEVYQRLTACVRGTSSFPRHFYLTCNPGGRGHGWVKRLFVDRRFRDGENPADYRFIQSFATDNDALMQMDPRYMQRLDALPAKLRAAWRDGDWNIFQGQFFEEFVDNPDHYEDRKWTHVIAPFDIPKDWKIIRSYDWGYAHPFSCGWWAVDHDRRLYRILEFYGCVKDSPNEGIKMTTVEQFRQIAQIEREHPYLAGRRIEGVADPSIWAEDGGVSTAEVAARAGVYFCKGDNKRIPGWMQVHYRMQFDEHGLPMMYVFNNCRAFIRTMPLLVYDEHHPEDLDTEGEDHVADEVRYTCMLNPINPPVKPTVPPVEYDPLDLSRPKATFIRI